jgi:transcriptional regulator with GAF, ATPase, and Fis domain
MNRPEIVTTSSPDPSTESARTVSPLVGAWTEEGRLIEKRRIDSLFGRLMCRLEGLYPVNKALLALYDPTARRFQVMHVMDRRGLRTGVRLTIAADDSILFQVFCQGFPVVDNTPEQMPASPIERKLLMSEQTRSVLMVPLYLDDVGLGVLALSADHENAFHPYLDGVGTAVVNRFVRLLGSALSSIEATLG